jgi:glycosidase
MIRRLRLTAQFALILLLLAASLSAQKPQIAKVEPPNWWAAMPSAPMLLLSGSHLDHATVSTTAAGVHIARTQSTAAGHYLFVWLEFAPTLAPGTVSLAVHPPGGETELRFPIEARRDHTRTRGLTRDDILYLVMPDRFADGDPSNDELKQFPGHYDRATPKAYHGGDLKGIEQHLDYLQQLGITALWMTPFVENDPASSDYHGYHATDLYAVEDHFGSLEELQHLVAEAHKRGIKIVMDYVVNHVGPNHPWATQPPTPTWLHGSPQNHLDPQYDFWPLVDPHAPARDRRPVLEGWFAGKLPDLNTDDPLLERYLSDNAIWWTEQAGVDAFRLDTFPYSSRQSWSLWHRAVHQAEPGINTVGEAWNTDPIITSFFVGGQNRQGIDTGLDTVFDFPLFDALRQVLIRRQPVARLTNVLRQDALYQHPLDLVTMIGNHDTRRFMGEDGATLEELNAAVSLLMTLRGIPQIYSGDEIAMPGGDDPDNRHDFPGGFPGDTRNAFTEQGRTAVEQAAFAHLQRMIALRRQHKALRRGEQVSLFADDSSYVFLRQSGEDTLLVVFNNSGQPRHLSVSLEDTPLASSSRTAALEGAGTATIANHQLTVDAQPLSVAVYAVQ